MLSLQFGNQSILARFDSKIVDQIDEQVYISWDENDLHYFDYESSLRNVD